MYIVKIPTPLFMHGIHKFKTKKAGLNWIDLYLKSNSKITLNQASLIYILKEIK
jgi:hypothetical protein